MPRRKLYQHGKFSFANGKATALSLDGYWRRHRVAQTRWRDGIMRHCRQTTTPRARLPSSTEVRTRGSTDSASNTGSPRTMSNVGVTTNRWRSPFSTDAPKLRRRPEHQSDHRQEQFMGSQLVVLADSVADSGGMSGKFGRADDGLRVTTAEGALLTSHSQAPHGNDRLQAQCCRQRPGSSTQHSWLLVSNESGHEQRQNATASRCPSGGISRRRGEVARNTGRRQIATVVIVVVVDVSNRSENPEHVKIDIAGFSADTENSNKSPGKQLVSALEMPDFARLFS